MTNNEKVKYIDRQIQRTASKHRAAVLRVIRGYGQTLLKSLATNDPQTVLYNIPYLMQVEPMRDALLMLWLDASVKFTNITARQLGNKPKYNYNEFQLKLDPRIVLAELLQQNPELEALYMDLFSYFQGVGGARVVTIVDTYRTQGEKAIKQALEDITSLGVGEKEGAQLLNRYIEDVWKGSLFQAERIVRTETHAAANTSSLNEAINTGANVVKIWGAYFDQRTRKSHLDADGQVRELSQPFDINGVSIGVPGDPNVTNHPEEIINCRCTVLYKRKV